MESKLEPYWQLCLEGLKAGKTKLSLPKAITAEVDLSGLEQLKQCVKGHTKSGVKLQIEDDAVVLELDRQVKGSGSKSGRPKEKKIPRPPNQWILFRAHHHHAILAKNPGMDVYTISKVISAMWSDASEEEKAFWKAKAIENARLHKLKYPDYTYAPRKASEVKRRNTKAKAASRKVEENMEDVLEDFGTDGEFDEFDDVFDNIPMDVDGLSADSEGQLQAVAGPANALVAGSTVAPVQTNAAAFQSNFAYANMGHNSPLSLLYAHASGFDASTAPHPSLWAFTPQMLTIGLEATDPTVRTGFLGSNKVAMKSLATVDHFGEDLLPRQRTRTLGPVAGSRTVPTLDTASHFGAQYPFGFAGSTPVSQNPASAVTQGSNTHQPSQAFGTMSIQPHNVNQG